MFAEVRVNRLLVCIECCSSHVAWCSNSLSSLRERFKLFEESSKDQMTKLEVELKVTSAQLREVSYANRDNAAQIAELKRSLETAAKESKSAKSRLETAEQSLGQLRIEREELQRDRTTRELQRSSSKSAIESFVRALQHILALVKLDAYPLDEALREVLRLTHAAFGAELALDRVLADEDEAEEFEEELDDDDILEAQRTRRTLRKNGLLLLLPPGDDDNSGGGVSDDGAISGERRLTQLTSMSKFRKSKLDKQVKQLQRDSENKSDVIRSLESALCEQADALALVSRTSEQQQERLERQANRIGMLLADVDATATVLADVRAAKRHAERDQRIAEMDRDAEIARALEMQRTLERTQRQFDLHDAASEDLLAKIWRAYEHELLMLSLRRDAAVQATVWTASHETQTLVPHRNPATERARISSMHLPAASPLAATFEDVLQQIHSHAKALLPDVADEGGWSLDSAIPLQKKQSDGLSSTVPVVQSAHRVGGGGRISDRTNAQHRKRYERTCGKQLRHADAQLLTGLPLLDPHQTLPPQAQAYPPHILRHVNEFGLRQDVLISPVYPPYFSDRSVHQPPLHPAVTHLKTPRKPEHSHRRYRQQQPQQDSPTDQGDERCRSPIPETAYNGNLRRRSPPSGRRQLLRHSSPPVESGPGDSGDTGLRYHRGFLRTGMEVLRNAVGFPEDDEDDDDSDAMSDGDADPRRRLMGGIGYSLSPRSPGRLEEAIRGHQKELDEQQSGAQRQRQRRREAYKKDDDVRGAASARDDGFSVDADVLKELGTSPFVPAVLYPLLPPHQ